MKCSCMERIAYSGTLSDIFQELIYVKTDMLTHDCNPSLRLRQDL